MRLLFVTSRFPYPPIYGDQVRSFHLLRHLSKRHDITLISPEPRLKHTIDRKTLDSLCKSCILVPIRWRDIIISTLYFLFSPFPLQSLYFCPQIFKETVYKAVNDKRFDLVHIQLARMAPAAHGIHVPRVLDFIDALSLNMRLRSKREPWPLSWLLLLESKRMARYERFLVFTFEQKIVSSPVDKQVLGDHGTIHVVPNGVDTAAFCYNESGRDSNTIVFTGHMSYLPNIEAAIYFARNVFPIIRKQVADARFLIVGANPPKKLQKLADLPGIEVTGYVSQIWDYLARATVAVAPVQIGTGIQNKVLEAMASGAPVVATSCAIKGIEAINGEHLLIADNAEGLAEHILRLLQDPVLRRQLARNARRLVEEKYTWERVTVMVEQIYQLAINSRNRTG